MELYQAEWCPHSHKVRQRLTELGLDFVARQVAANPDDRDELEHVLGTREIPTLVTERREVFIGEDDILAFLDRCFDERDDADRHRAKASEEVREFAEVAPPS
jgi:glutathione S-transferase